MFCAGSEAPLTILLAVAKPNVEGWVQVGELALALALSALIGAEREIRQKSAGLRTHTLVGLGAALFVLVSKYGFADVLGPKVQLDPSRVAAQIVSGIGFVGAGLIFVRRNSVRGLTTAVAVWLTAAVGAAAGAGLPVLAVVATAMYFVVAVVFPIVGRHLPNASTSISTLRLEYPDGRGALREILEKATAEGFAVDEISTEPLGYRRPPGGEEGADRVPMVGATIQVHGAGAIGDLTAALAELENVRALAADDPSAGGE